MNVLFKCEVSLESRDTEDDGVLRFIPMNNVKCIQLCGKSVDACSMFVTICLEDVLFSPCLKQHYTDYQEHAMRNVGRNIHKENA